MPVFLILVIAACQSNKEDKTVKADFSKLYPGDELTIQHGLDLFVTHCANCHNFEENGIGPNLSGVTRQQTKEWLVKFIANPIAVIKSGDAHANELFKTYKQYMTPFPQLKKEEVDHLLSYIHKFSEGNTKSKSNRAGALLDPIKEKIPQSDLAIVLKQLTTITPSATTSPFTRINKMVSLKVANKERLLIVDLRGKMYELVHDTSRVFFDMRAIKPNLMDKPGLASGFGSFAFHPDYLHNGLMYTVHTELDSLATVDFALPDSVKTAVQYVLTEWKTKTPNEITFSGTPRELMRIGMQTVIHGMQDIEFNPLSKKGDPDYGMLYIGIGDGGSSLAGHPELTAPTHIWGKVIRIDPLGQNSANKKYGIPKDNPFINRTGYAPEIWMSGFRNPHLIRWDPESKQMLVTNIGQHSIEEVNLGVKGFHYGWPYREGSFLFDITANAESVYPAPANDTMYTPPVIQYDHDEGNAISGGFVYHGKIPLLKGKYLFGDIPRGIIFYSESKDIKQGSQAPIKKMSVMMDNQLTDLESITKSNRVDLRFGMDGTGELFVFCKSNGGIYKIIDCKKPSQIK